VWFGIILCPVGVAAYSARDDIPGTKEVQQPSLVQLPAGFQTLKPKWDNSRLAPQKWLKNTRRCHEWSVSAEGRPYHLYMSPTPCITLACTRWFQKWEPGSRSGSKRQVDRRHNIPSTDRKVWVSREADPDIPVQAWQLFQLKSNLQGQRGVSCCGRKQHRGVLLGWLRRSEQLSLPMWFPTNGSSHRTSRIYQFKATLLPENL